MSTETPSATVIGILRSETELNAIVRKLDLLTVYHVSMLVDARKLLLSHTTFSADKNSGIVTITVMDRDRHRAQSIAQQYIEELNLHITALNSSSAHREREFLEARLAAVKLDLDDTAAKLSQFSSKSGTLNPQVQGQALITSTVQLQSQMIVAQAELHSLKAKYSDDNTHVREASARVEELRRQIVRLGTGSSERGDTTATIYPGMRQLPALGATYEDLSRKLKVQEAAYELLTKQYEIAKVQEAKELPTVKILDYPDLAEKKSSPKRAAIVLIATFLAPLAALGWLVTGRVWDDLDPSHPLRAIYDTVTHAKNS